MDHCIRYCEGGHVCALIISEYDDQGQPPNSCLCWQWNGYFHNQNTNANGENPIHTAAYHWNDNYFNGHLCFGQNMFVHIFSNDKHSRVAIPQRTTLNLLYMLSAITSSHSVHKSKRVWSSTYELKLYLEWFPQYYTEERFYSGWTHDHSITNFIIFGPVVTFFNP